MLHKSSEANLEELYHSIEAEEFIVFQFVIFRFERLSHSIDNQIFTPVAFGRVSQSPNLPFHSDGVKTPMPEAGYNVSSPK